MIDIEEHAAEVLKTIELLRELDQEVPKLIYFGNEEQMYVMNLTKLYIGTSVEDRAILAHKLGLVFGYGSDATRVLFVSDAYVTEFNNENVPLQFVNLPDHRDDCLIVTAAEKTGTRVSCLRKYKILPEGGLEWQEPEIKRHSEEMQDANVTYFFKGIADAEHRVKVVNEVAGGALDVDVARRAAWDAGVTVFGKPNKVED